MPTREEISDRLAADKRAGRTRIAGQACEIRSALACVLELQCRINRTAGSPIE
jgi:hypothetical protein